MIHLWLRVCGALVLICALALAFVHSIHLGNTDLIAFFSPPQGCAAPCFLGIRPGVTTRAEASVLLHAQPWIARVIDTPDALTWVWNGKQPAFISDPPSDVEGGQVYIAGEKVVSITLSTATDWADFFGAFGPPDQEFFRAGESFTGFYPFLTHGGSYNAFSFEVESNTLCPLRSRADLWYSPVSFVLPSEPVGGTVPITKGC